MVSPCFAAPEKPRGSGSEPVDKKALFATLPPDRSDPGIGAVIRSDIKRLGRKVAVLDDDPTGTQTVHDVDIFTETSVERLSEALASTDDLFYILTNTRAMPAEQARALNIDIAGNLTEASLKTGRPFDIVSRSDSTLRGHYPLEIDALAEILEHKSGCHFDGHILIPFFQEGGRYTIDDVHWIEEGDQLIPAALTEYAKDPVFSYTTSDLRAWVVEKTKRRYSLDQIVSIPLKCIRFEGPEGVAQRLNQVRGGVPVIVNCAGYSDLQVFVGGLLQAELNGKRFLFRTAASFIKARCAIDERPLLTAREIIPEGAAESGIIIVGSYVQKTSRQILALEQLPGIRSIELNVERILDPGAEHLEIQDTAQALNGAISSGLTGVVYTSRIQVQMASGTPEAAFAIGQTVSSALVEIVQLLRMSPRFIVAKGGITSSDIATRGLNIRRARVLGQIAPGVPVWRTGLESRFPNIPYVVFPGNVGGDETLAQVVTALR